MTTLSNKKIADCLERVADDHSGSFTEEDAVIVEQAIIRLRDTGPTLSNKVVDTQEITDELFAGLRRGEIWAQGKAMDILSALRTTLRREEQDQGVTPTGPGSRASHEGEAWRSLVGYPGYEASSAGRIRNRSGKIIRQTVSSENYRKVALFVAGKRHDKTAHRLIAEAFHGPCPDGMVCRHINGDAADNRPDNLQWVTPSENERDKPDRLSLDEIEAIVEAAGSETQKILAERYGVSVRTIQRVQGDARRASSPKASIPNAELLDDIAVMMSEFVDNWPNPKKVSTALALIAKTLRAALDENEAVALERAIDRMGWPEIHAFQERMSQDVYEDAGGFVLRKIKRLFGIYRDPVLTYQEAARAMVAKAKGDAP